MSPEKPFLIDHSEAHALGIASAHGDVSHWFPKFGKSMNTFRADVKAAINAKVAATADTFYRVQVGAYNSKALAENYNNELKKKGITNAFVTEVKKS